MNAQNNRIRDAKVIGNHLNVKYVSEISGGRELCDLYNETVNNLNDIELNLQEMFNRNASEAEIDTYINQYEITEYKKSQYKAGYDGLRKMKLNLDKKNNQLKIEKLRHKQTKAELREAALQVSRLQAELAQLKHRQKIVKVIKQSQGLN